MPFVLQALLEGVDVVGAEGDVAALDGVDRLARAEADAEVLLRQVKLGVAVAEERDLAGIAAAQVAVGLEEASGRGRGADSDEAGSFSAPVVSSVALAGRATRCASHASANSVPIA